MTLDPGLSLGPYEILSSIGAGGMGEVYAARDTRLGRRVALKILPVELARNAARLSRFELEAKAAAALNHPHIAAVFDVGSAPCRDGEGTLYYIVQELLEGETLRELLARGAPPLRKTLAITAEIAEALAVAHAAGVIHRDLKPENLFVTEEGHAKILDFGLAKLTVRTDGRATGDTASPTLTAAGMVLGTAGYMAPEQIENTATIDRRADLFGLGCVLYELLTGARAFAGSSLADTLSKILHQEPQDVAERVPGLPARLGWITRKCLAKDRADRYQGAADLAVDLRSVASKPDLAAEATHTSPPSPPRRWRWRWRWWSLAAGAVVLAALGGLQIGRQLTEEADRPIRRFVIRTQDAQVLATRSGRLLAVSPDGGSLVYVDRNQLWLRDLSELAPRLLVAGGLPISPFFSPDGQWLAYSDSVSLQKVWLEGGDPFALCDRPAVGGGSWSTDDTLVFSDGSSLWTVAADGGDCRRLTVDGGPSHRFPEWLPDERTILTMEVENGESRVAVLSANSGEVLGIVIAPAGNPHFLPPDTLLFSRSQTLLATRFDPRAAAALGEPTPVLAPVANLGSQQLALSRGGTLAYVPGEKPELELIWVDRSGRQERISEIRQDYWVPRLSPSGERLAVGARRAGTFDLLLHDLERDTQDLLARRAFWPAWSADGARVAYATSLVSGEIRLAYKTVDSSDPPRLLLEASKVSPRFVLSLSRSPEILAYNEIHPTQSRDIWILPTKSGGKPVEVVATDGEEFAPRLSPDARWLAYASDQSGREEVYVVGCRPCRPDLDLPDVPVRVSVASGTAPVWRGDGAELFYLEGNRMMAVNVTAGDELELGEPEVLFEGSFVPDQFGNPNYDVTADGQRFVMIRSTDLEATRFRINVVLNWGQELRETLEQGN